MTNGAKTVFIPVFADKERIKVQLIHHNIYRQLKKARFKYDLSGNNLLVLNGIYLYSILIKTEFTKTSIRSFVKYYNQGRMEYYFNKLLDKGMIEQHRTAGSHIYYRLTNKANECINDIYDDYDLIHSKFIQQFNISL